MKYRRLGNSGLKVSELSFGSWITFGSQIEDNTAKDLLYYAYEQGINFFDNAETYAKGKSEEVMGKILKQAAWPRDSYVLSSKAFFGRYDQPKPTQTGLSRKHLVEACHQALGRLQTEYLDLYFCHRPDAEVPLLEIVQTMTHLVQQGKIFYWGTSEWPASAIAEACQLAREWHLIAPVVEQPQYSLLVQDRVEMEYELLYKNFGIGTTIWSPLGSGLLSGKYSSGIPTDSRIGQTPWLKKLLEGESVNGMPASSLQAIQPYTSLAEEVGLPLYRFALAWCLKNKNVSTVILGASRVDQLKLNLLAADDVSKITDEVLAKVKKIKNELLG